MNDNKNKNSLTILDNSTNALVEDIINEEDINRTKEMISLFNINMAKKNIVRVNALNNLLDKVNDQASERFEKRPEDVSNKDLLNYMNTVQSQIEKSSNIIKSINETPAIQLNQQNNVTVNIDNSNTTLDRASRERILAAVQSVVNESKNIEENIVEVQVVSTENEE